MTTALIFLLLFWIALVGVCTHALWRGEGPEKMGALVLVVGSVASAFLASPVTSRFESTELGIMLADLVMLLFLLWLALTSTRHWPIWATSFHITGLLTHLADAALPAPLPGAYSLLQGFFAYPVIFCLFLGTYGLIQSRKLDAE